MERSRVALGEAGQVAVGAEGERALQAAQDARCSQKRHHVFLTQSSASQSTLRQS